MTQRIPSRIGLLALVLAFGLVGARPAGAQGLGVAAGLNFNSMDDIETASADAAFESSTGYHVGAFYELGLGPLAVRPGVVYHRLGTYDFGVPQQMDLSAIEVPLDVKLTVLPLPAVSGYLLGSPVLTFGQTDAEFENAVEDLTMTADLGAGVDISLPGTGLLLSPELRYSIGVTDYLSDSFEVGGTTVQPSDDVQQMSKVMVRLNVAF